MNYKKVLIPLLALLLTACGGGSSSSGAASDAPAAGAITNVVAISDSFGTGFGLATPWPTLLADALGVPVFNDSVNGRETPVGVAIIQGLLDSQNPSHVVILLGTNDALSGVPSEAASNLQQMVDIANANDVIAIVGTLAPITQSAAQDANAASISSAILGISGAQIADIRAQLGPELIVDGIHPADEGQQLITDIFLAEF